MANWTIAVANGNSDSLTVVLGRGSGCEFCSGRTAARFRCGPFSTDIAVVDLNADDAMDEAVAKSE
jgi:hypothetical protein